MVATQASTMWVHGHSLQVEDTHALAGAWRSGFCMYVEGKQGTSNWLHFAVPTPALLDGRGQQLAEVLLDLETLSDDAVVSDIHVYDGATKVADFANLGLCGDVGLVRLEVPGHPEVHEAIGISVGVSFGVGSVAHGISVAAAGCTFLGCPGR